jgi:hypothetical protein
MKNAMPTRATSKLQPSPGTCERRRNLRVTPDPLLVIRFASGNAGIVLDVSQEGLGFLASAPVEETQSIRFEIAGRSTLSSEAVGRLMWKDSSGKRAGLKFTQLPHELRTLIHNCLPAEKPPRALQNEPKAASATGLALEETLRAFPGRNSKRMMITANAVTCVLACFIALGILRSVDRHSTVGAPFHWEQQITRLLSLLRTPTGSINSVKPAQSLVPASAKPQKLVTPSVAAAVPFPAAGPEAIQPAPPASAQALASPANLVSGANLISAANLDSSKSAEPAAAVHRANEAAPVAAKRTAPPSLPDAGQAALALAQDLLRKDPDAEQQAQAAQLLWQAVEKGNVGAEVALADLYLVGQGVAKSCSQARVLLRSAQNRKSDLAQKKLEKLSPYGCE